MKCRYCGHEIPEGELICKKCGEEVFIVPDYNPLEDMLTAQIKIGVNDEDADYLDDIAADVRKRTSPRRHTGSSQNMNVRRNTGTGRNMNAGRYTNTGSNSGGRRNTNVRRNTGTGRNMTDRELYERERRRRQAEHKKEMIRKKRQKALLTLTVVIIVILTGCFVLYQNSYSGIVGNGYRALKNQEYGSAENYFRRGIEKNEKKADAYTGLAQTYVRQNQLSDANELFAGAIDKQKNNTELYEAYIIFCIDSKQQMTIPLLLDEAPENIREKLSEYIIEEPEFDLDEGEVYEEVHQLEITASGSTIYYTTDKSEPTLSSTKYSEPIQLTEGENIIRAIAVDERGIPSMSVEKTYVVEFPVEDAPAVSPSTGQYEQAQKIEIKVPEGYEAYYTLTGDDPTTASSKYSGPVDMPEGETLFKAILVNGSGRSSGVTTRNYMLEIEEE